MENTMSVRKMIPKLLGGLRLKYMAHQVNSQHLLSSMKLHKSALMNKE
jgi:hypothetical protein